MKLTNTSKMIGISLIAFVMSGCVTSQNLPVANQKNLIPGNALIKVEREKGFIGGGRQVDVTDNAKLIGELSQGKSLVWQRKPGKMALNLVPSWGTVKAFPPIIENVKAGKTYNYIVTLSSARGSFIIEEK